MAKLRIGREILKSALDRAILSDTEKATIDRLLGAASAKGPVNTEVAAFNRLATQVGASTLYAGETSEVRR